MWWPYHSVKGVANPDPETTYYNYDRAAELGTGVARLLSGVMTLMRR